ncbi:hypothetical protein Tco_0639184 [Tanacetum coccineum]
MKDQPLPANASPTALSPGYIADSNPEEDEEDPEEDPTDHHVDGGDKDDNKSSDDDEDDDDVEKDEHAIEFCLAAVLPSSSLPPSSVMIFHWMKPHIHFIPCDLQEMMATVNQGMSIEEIERVVAQRVANAIEAIAIYETKTNMARKSTI